MTKQATTKFSPELRSRAVRMVVEHRGEQPSQSPAAMKPIPLSPETEMVARRVIWFEEPAEALADPIRFMAYAMASATHEEL